jgi:hypothetical protein
VKHIAFLLFFFGSMIPTDLIAQYWHRLYFTDLSSSLGCGYESYDHGYVLGGVIYLESGLEQGYILKTDINGQMLWHKKVISLDEFMDIWDIKETESGGMILTGMTGEYSAYGNPYIMKLNSCGEVEWCRVFDLPSTNDEWGRSIWTVPGGSVALIYAYGDNEDQDRIWLYRMDNDGELLWKKVYSPTDTSVMSPEGLYMYMTQDYKFIINGVCYYPDSGSPWPKYLRPYILKIDSTGSLDWDLIWTSVNTENFYGESYHSVTNASGIIYSSARHIILVGPNTEDKPVMLTTSNDGYEINYSTLVSGGQVGGTHTIDWILDSSIVIGYGKLDSSSNWEIGLIKCDPQGHILKTKPMYNSFYLFTDGINTFDNKLLLVSAIYENNKFQSYADKVNSDLEYDSIYTNYFQYDTLCSHPIPSDTIFLGCSLVGISEKWKDMNPMLIGYPNPFNNILNVKIPDQISRIEKGKQFNVTTYLYRWKSTILEIYNIKGELVFSKEVPFSCKEIQVNTLSWENGFYLVRLVYDNSSIETIKLVK